MTGVPAAKFSKDHWSLFAYLETVCVEGQRIDKARLRCCQDRHPFHNVNGFAWKSSWGTRLKGFFEYSERNDPIKAEAADVFLSMHDDWDVIADLVHAGLLTADITSSEPLVQITEQGFLVAAALRKHKADGRNFANFRVVEAPRNVDS